MSLNWSLKRSLISAEVIAISTSGENEKTASPASAPSLSGVHLLLVDDSADNQRLFERILTSVGAKVDVAENGVVAVARAQATRYDVIIMDIRMPMMDGYEATRRIREQGFTGPILALTAHANPGEEERCRAAGCSGFYLKPINRAGLLQAVADAL